MGGNKGNFREFETEIIAQLDGMIFEEGKGDGMYKDKFHSILSNQCEQHMALKEPGARSGFKSCAVLIEERNCNVMVHFFGWIYN